ncbi:MAG: guanylate kinase [Lysobacterales bacterium]|jgi:guanylate kinase|nr:MAG: guanylate kinase [Xanthomonadales bacterium]
MSGSLFIISAPSGAGKTSLVRALIERDPAVRLSVSHTTRPPRPGERPGVDYHFVDEARFLDLIARGAFLEHAEVFGARYGTSVEEVDPWLERGIDVFLDIDWQGARQVRSSRPEAVSVFVLPPSREVLLERLRRRGQDSPEVIARRMAGARAELAHHAEYDYLLVNDRFADALAGLQSIVAAARLSRRVQMRRQADLLAELLAEDGSV